MLYNNLKQYFELIIQKFEANDFKYRGKKGLARPEIDSKYYYLEAINYLMYEWCLDNKQSSRIPKIFDYVMIPNNVNNQQNDFDFTNISFEQFFDFLVSIKNTDTKITYEKRKKVIKK